MDYKVEFKDSFLDVLEQIVAGIAGENATAAGTLGEMIVAAAESLAFFPQRHPCVRQRPMLRRFVVARYYKVFYRIQPENRLVQFLRVWDGRRGCEPVTE